MVAAGKTSLNLFLPDAFVLLVVHVLLLCNVFVNIVLLVFRNYCFRLDLAYRCLCSRDF